MELEIFVVSIHAPVKGTTTGIGQLRRIVGVSIHAPVKGTTFHGSLSEHVLTLVSIHAPVKGTTFFFARIKRPVTRFNPRSREGNDKRRPSGPLDPSRFNPRSREGNDFCPCRLFFGLPSVSIHAPVKGTTIHRFYPRALCGCFNPRSREGNDCTLHLTSSCPSPVSIHAPVKGTTPCP